MATIVGAIEATGCEKKILKTTAPSESTVVAKANNCPRPRILMVFSSDLCRNSAYFSAILRILSADPDSVLSYFSNSVDGGSGPIYCAI